MRQPKMPLDWEINFESNTHCFHWFDKWKRAKKWEEKKEYAKDEEGQSATAAIIMKFYIGYEIQDIGDSHRWTKKKTTSQRRRYKLQ